MLFRSETAELVRLCRGNLNASCEQAKRMEEGLFILDFDAEIEEMELETASHAKAYLSDIRFSGSVSRETLKEVI